MLLQFTSAFLGWMSQALPLVTSNYILSLALIVAIVGRVIRLIKRTFN